MYTIDLIKLISLIQRLYPFGSGQQERVQQDQERRLRALLQTAAAKSEFYRQRFSGIDVARASLSDLPVLTKAEMMRNFDAVVTDPRIKQADVERFVADPGNLGKLYLNRYRVSHTSGSQGQPALIIQDADALILLFAARFARGTLLPRGRVSHIHRLWKPARMAVFTARPGFYPSSSAFTYRPSVLAPVFKLLRLSISDPLPETIAKLEAFRPEYITGYASALQILAREEVAGRLRLNKIGTLRQLTNVAEPLPQPIAADLEQAFGVHVFNEYAMGECMAATSGCTTTHGAHVNSDLAIIEVVDEKNRPVPPGVQGHKILLTNLYNTVQPIIRYEIDDRVTMSATPCACGRILPKVEKIEGRTKDYLWAKIDGRVQELPYYIFIHAFNHVSGIAEHQVIQTGQNKVLLRAAPLPGKVLSAEQVGSLVREALRVEKLDGVIDAEIEIVPEIARGPSGKIARVKNEYGPPSAG